ncbi:uncharacterized protein LOC132312616 [Cornus florida]|uniref:uncharacterized protein LOC132312616 n=1 Tax=Cornus florida TaxID=4283 RepID=UPI00289C489A|nr:uncharacterized protein LOC132312616 [Cornus florida]
MAVTHADLAPSRPKTDLGSKTGAFLVVLSILFGLFCFILCLIAEVTRSEVTWVSNGDGYECTYSGSGKKPLLCAAAAFMGLAVAVVVQHTFVMIAVSKSTPPSLVAWDLDSAPAKTLTWHAAFFFIATWICFAVGEILLLIGLSVESGHLKNWTIPRPSCLTVRQGMFSAAGVFGLITVFLAAGLYITALRIQRLIQEQEMVQREVLEASVLYASPPWSPPHRLTSAANENPIVRQNQNENMTLADYLSVFDKRSSLV